MRLLRPVCFFLLASSLLMACQRETIIPEQVTPVERPSIIPEKLDSVPRMYITVPQKITSRDYWTDSCSVRIVAKIQGRDTLVFEADSAQVKGRGNSSWSAYPKKPYALKLKEKANLIGTGKTRHWVLLANWMDRTLLRNQVAFEAARRTSLEWTPSGIFVELYMNDPDYPEYGFEYKGLYWLGEKVRVEGSHFKADYFYSFDTSDKNEADFYAWCHYFQGGVWQEGEVPVTVRYPDKDDYPQYYWISYLRDECLNALQDMEDAIYHMGTDTWRSKVDLDTFCDWYIVHELCFNKESRHPKSCFMYIRDGVFYAGPIWDFDWNTFIKSDEVPHLKIRSSLYYFQLFPQPAFRNRLKARWKVLKPRFESLLDYIDQQADWIRVPEERNHDMWPCYPNPMAEAENDGHVNFDEDLSFQEAVDKMKEAVQWRIDVLEEQFALLE